MGLSSQTLPRYVRCFLEYFMMMTLLLVIPTKEIRASSIILVFVCSTSSVRSILSCEEFLSRFVKFQLGDFTVRWVDWDLDLGAVLLVSDDLLNMDAPSSSVYGEDFSDLTFDSVLNTSGFDLNGVALSDWKRSAVVLGSKFLA